MKNKPKAMPTIADKINQLPDIPLNELLKDISVCYSRGRGKGGRRANFIRPNDNCYNRSRRVTGFTDGELDDKIVKVVLKWYYPLKFYKVDNLIIGSNSEENALREFWRSVRQKRY